jgi:hypothetical protein
MYALNFFVDCNVKGRTLSNTTRVIRYDSFVVSDNFVKFRIMYPQTLAIAGGWIGICVYKFSSPSKLSCVLTEKLGYGYRGDCIEFD